MAKAKQPFGRPVATRDLFVEKSRKKVRVEVGKPFQGDRCYTCQFRITFGKTQIQQAIHGVDEFQSLELALKMIPTYPRHVGRLPRGRMYAFEKGDDMGFPEVYI